MRVSPEFLRWVGGKLWRVGPGPEGKPAPALSQALSQALPCPPPEAAAGLESLHGGGGREPGEPILLPDNGSAPEQGGGGAGVPGCA